MVVEQTLLQSSNVDSAQNLTMLRVLGLLAADNEPHPTVNGYHHHSRPHPGSLSSFEWEPFGLQTVVLDDW